MSCISTKAQGKLQDFTGPQWSYRDYSMYNQKVASKSTIWVLKTELTSEKTHLNPTTLQNFRKHKNTQIHILLTLRLMSSHIM